MGSGGIRLGFDWDLSGTAWDARDRGPLGTARDRGTAWDRSGPLRTAAPDWVRSVGSAASAVGSAAKRCWARQPLELKRGSRGGSPWERKAGVRGRQPQGKKSGGPGAAAPGIEDYSFMADTFILF